MNRGPLNKFGRKLIRLFAEQTEAKKQSDGERNEMPKCHGSIVINCLNLGANINCCAK